MRDRRPTPQRHLFGPPPPVRRDESPVTIPMQEVTSGTDKALFLAPLGRKPVVGGWVARALVTRVAGKQQLFTMPRWVAAERGWL